MSTLFRPGQSDKYFQPSSTITYIEPESFPKVPDEQGESTNEVYNYEFQEIEVTNGQAYAARSFSRNATNDYLLLPPDQSSYDWTQWSNGFRWGWVVNQREFENTFTTFNAGWNCEQADFVEHRSGGHDYHILDFSISLGFGTDTADQLIRPPAFYRWRASQSELNYTFYNPVSQVDCRRFSSIDVNKNFYFNNEQGIVADRYIYIWLDCLINRPTGYHNHAEVMAGNVFWFSLASGKADFPQIQNTFG